MMRVKLWRLCAYLAISDDSQTAALMCAFVAICSAKLYHSFLLILIRSLIDFVSFGGECSSANFVPVLPGEKVVGISVSKRTRVPSEQPLESQNFEPVSRRTICPILVVLKR